jgi:hypothetical protein
MTRQGADLAGEDVEESEFITAKPGMPAKLQFCMYNNGLIKFDAIG